MTKRGMAPTGIAIFQAQVSYRKPSIFSPDGLGPALCGIAQ